jgi:indolepyruvate ferredoxin oxidoreductase
MCPSFVTVTGGKLRAADTKEHVFDDSVFAGLPEPARAPASTVTNILIAGIGGGGIVTLGAILGMAAHMEERPCNILDITGAAQRNGAVTSHVRIGTAGIELRSAPRIPALSCDLILGADMVVASGRDVLATMSAGRSAAVYNSYVAPTAAFAQNANLSFSTDAMEKALAGRCRDGQAFAVPATEVATRLLGNAIGANMMLLGAAYQRGLVPLSLQTIESTIVLNGTEVAMNTRAFRLGRLSVARPEKLAELMRARTVKDAVPKLDSLDSLIADRKAWLTDYQNAAYAERYEALVTKVAEAERRITGTEGALAESVARYYAKLLAYKDEYEVARLMTRKAFFDQLADTFEGNYRLSFNLAPPLFSRRDPQTGRYRKKEFGPWVLALFRIMAPFKVLRGTPLDIFGYAAHRRHERQLIAEYEETIGAILETLTIENLPAAIEIARLPEIVRGYDVVKDAGIAEMETMRAELLGQMRRPADSPSGAARAGKQGALSA